MKIIQIYRDAEAQPLFARVTWARHAWERMRGLIGRRPLAPGEGLLLTPCAAVHTCLMRYPLDLVFLDRFGVIVKCLENVRPYRFAWAPRARHTLELPAGSVRASGLAVGERLRWTDSRQGAHE